MISPDKDDVATCPEFTPQKLPREALKERKIVITNALPLYPKCNNFALQTNLFIFASFFVKRSAKTRHVIDTPVRAQESVHEIDSTYKRY